jgi:hypothetical protein
MEKYDPAFRNLFDWRKLSVVGSTKRKKKEKSNETNDLLRIVPETCSGKAAS